MIDENFTSTYVQGSNRVNQGNKDSKNKRCRDLYKENKEFCNKRRRELYAKKRINESNQIQRKSDTECLHIMLEGVLTHEALRNKKDIQNVIGSGSNASEAHNVDEYEVTNQTRTTNLETNLTIKGDRHDTTFDLERIPIDAYTLPLPTMCTHCGVKKFWRETNTFYCGNGEIRLQINDAPDKLYKLSTSKSAESLEFKTYIRTYNSNFAFTSFGVKYGEDLCKRDKGVYIFRIQGQVYHCINELLPLDNCPSYLQLYFYDTEHELENRLKVSSKLAPSTLQKIIDILKINPYCRFFRSLSDVTNLANHNIQG